MLFQAIKMLRNAVFLDIDECLDEPCQHDGICSNSLGSYSCNCTGTGFVGAVCEEGYTIYSDLW